VLIRNAEIWGLGAADLRITDGRIAAIGALAPVDGEAILEAGGGALLPGLHDHHIHMTALAARAASVFCGPPEVVNAEQLAARLALPGEGWLRGIGYHESVAGMLDRAMLDAMQPRRPLRIQHRSGRMWFLNAMALDMLLDKAPVPPTLDVATGRLFEADEWLRAALDSSPPSLSHVSAGLARHGITGITDMSPANDPPIAAFFTHQQQCGQLLQRCVMAGRLELRTVESSAELRTGLAKFHLHENALPPLEDSVAFIRAAHDQGWPVAVHCTTETELVFALAAIEQAGSLLGDRIEHASIAPDSLIEEMVRLNLRIVTQPHFIFERGDQYLEDVDAREQRWLYRQASLLKAGLILAGGSDAPFGKADPWAAMYAATTRRTRAGKTIGADEALSPEHALSLFLADPLDLAVQRRIESGGPADLCLLAHPWAKARTRLSSDDVHATLIAGSIVYNRVDQSPLQRNPGADPLA